ncbi:porin family protein, partial [Aurantiacibacter xanthus]
MALAIPGVAHAGETYIGVSAGVNTTNTENDGLLTSALPATPNFPAVPAGNEIAFNTDGDIGWGAGIQIGHRFDNGFRLELAGDYNSTTVDDHFGATLAGQPIRTLDASVLTRSAALEGRAVGPYLNEDTGSDIETYGLFLNALYDFNAGGTFSPYIGGGLGMMVVDVDYLAGGDVIADDSDVALAWQGIAGFSSRLSDSAELFAEYKYRHTFKDAANIEPTAFPMDPLNVHVEQHLGVVGVRFLMGAQTPPP